MASAASSGHVSEERRRGIMTIVTAVRADLKAAVEAARNRSRGCGPRRRRPRQTRKSRGKRFCKKGLRRLLYRSKFLRRSREKATRKKAAGEEAKARTGEPPSNGQFSALDNGHRQATPALGRGDAV